MQKKKRLLSILLCMCLCFSMFTPYASAKEGTKYATREYVISEFVQSVGRNQLDGSDAVLDIFADSGKISSQYKDDIGRAIVGGILKGYEDRTIRPKEPVRRIEVMVMLARCVPNLEATCDVIEFTDVPEWAKEDIAYLTKAGLVNGYGNGKLGSNDYITVEQVGFLVGRSDEALRTVAPGDSFYGYINEKAFRNAILENETAIDPLHGAVVTRSDEWSTLSDVYDEVVRDENEILNKIANNEIPIEKGTAEQRVRDMLECIDSNIAVTEADKKNITDMRNAIINAKDIDEFLEITGEIYKQAGINVAFDVNIDTDKVTGVPYPMFSIATAGHGGFLDFRAKTDTAAYKNIYTSLVSRYLGEIGTEFDKKDIEAAIKLQVASAKDVDYFYEIVSYFSFAYMFDIMTEEEVEAEVDAMIKRNPDFFDKNGNYIGTEALFSNKSKEAADAAYDGFDVCEELTDYGFTNLEKIIIPTRKITALEENIISNANLDALKINALLILDQKLGVALSNGESIASSLIKTFPLMVCLTSSANELSETLASEAEDAEKELFEETTGVEYDEGLLSAVNLNQLRDLLPDDIGLVYAKYYYDDETTEVISGMIQQISDAYKERFKNNKWMDAKTKENAIKKIDNMVSVIGYPKNYNFPTIVPMSEGGSLFSNTLNIRRQLLADLIRCNEDKEFIRTLMFIPADMVNACYIPIYNSINITAAILNKPIYDKYASYATNLGSVGMILAHEIGHAFDKDGAMYDENGCLKDWWTDKDYDEFQKIQDEFIDYYNKFEVVDGVVQDASITISENMADFAAMQIVMDIVGDDKKAQQECLESYARMWAQLGTVSYLTDSSILSDVHSSNVVRINAVVASFDAFYEIYGIEEGDAMYVPPEKRLRLW
ncbi:MAG: S-layer homology domain-containing protein [Clostridia bacterium]|nr:S-layer homology domain-containing protein [Clostridia bacterium]